MNRLIELLGTYMEQHTVPKDHRIDADFNRSDKIIFIVKGNVIIEHYVNNPVTSVDTNNLVHSIGLIKPAKTWLGLEKFEKSKDVCSKDLVLVVALEQTTYLTIPAERFNKLLCNELKDQKALIYELVAKLLSEQLIEITNFWVAQGTQDRYMLTFKHLEALARQLGKATKLGLEVTICAETLSRLVGCYPDAVRKHFQRLTAQKKILRTGMMSLVILKEKL